MHVIKAVKHIQNHRVIIELPHNFPTQDVEVFVFPYQSFISGSDNEDWKQDFRSISQWDVAETDRIS